MICEKCWHSIDWNCNWSLCTPAYKLKRELKREKKRQKKPTTTPRTHILHNGKLWKWTSFILRCFYSFTLEPRVVIFNWPNEIGCFKVPFRFTHVVNTDCKLNVMVWMAFFFFFLFFFCLVILLMFLVFSCEKCAHLTGKITIELTNSKGSRSRNLFDWDRKSLPTTSHRWCFFASFSSHSFCSQTLNRQQINEKTTCGFFLIMQRSTIVLAKCTRRSKPIKTKNSYQIGRAAIAAAKWTHSCVYGSSLSKCFILSFFSSYFYEFIALLGHSPMWTSVCIHFDFLLWSIV